MKINKKPCSVILALTALVLFLILISSTASASSTGPYAYIANQRNNSVSVIDTSTNTITAAVNVGDFPNGIAVTPDGKKVYVANMYGKNISVIDTTTNKVTTMTNVGGASPNGIAVTPDGTKVYVINYEFKTVSVINTANNTIVATLPVEGNYGIAVNPAGTRVYVTNTLGGIVSVINTATDTVVATVPVGFYPWGVAVSPDGTKVYATNSGNNMVSLIDNTTNKVITTVTVGNYPIGVAVSPDGKNVYTANCGDGTVSVIDTTTNKVTATINIGNQPWGVAVTPDGKRVYVTNAANNITSVIDTANNTIVATLPIESVSYTTGQFIGPTFGQTVLPVADFIANVSNGTVPFSVQFTDISQNASSWYWDFGDGSNSTEQNPIHTFSTTGNYTVNLTAINANGTDSKLAIITVLPPVLPVANFNTNVTIGYAPPSVQFNDSSENATEWNWNFGDRTNSTQQNPVHTYPLAGNYTVNLTVSNGNGTSSKLGTITVLTPMQTIKQMVTFEQSLVTSGELNCGPGDVLTSALNTAKISLNSGNTLATIIELKAFIAQVKICINFGIMSPTNGQTLIDEANAIINHLNSQIT
jgi:YVTN family beta-propeller protein